MIIRPATLADLPAINAIYNHYVLHSTATYQEIPETLPDRTAWFHRHGPNYPVTVAVQNDAILGWSSLSPFHARSAFRFTVENSLYVHHAHHRQGIGSTLLQNLIAQAQQLHYREIIAAIDCEQTASLALHASFGFQPAGRLKNIGQKFSRPLDVLYLQKSLL